MVFMWIGRIGHEYVKFAKLIFGNISAKLLPVA